jgi:hypothetical protein
LKNVEKFTYEELIEMLGPLDLVIINDHDGVRSRAWTCAECGHVIVSRKYVPPPPACYCGSDSFLKKGLGAVPAG